MFDRSGKLIRYETEAEMLAALTGNQLDPNIHPRFKQAMVVDAAGWGWNKALAKMLDEKEGFSPSEPDHKNWTPLGYATAQNRFATVKLLLSHMPGGFPEDEIDARNNAGPHFNVPKGWYHGDTALDLALERKHYHIARLLLAEGADAGYDSDGNERDGQAELQRIVAILKEQAKGALVEDP